MPTGRKPARGTARTMQSMSEFMQALPTTINAASVSSLGMAHRTRRQAELVRLVTRHAGSEGLHETAIAPLQLLRASAPALPLPAIYEPSLLVVVQGSKQALLAGRSFRYDPLHCLLVTVTMPIVGQIIEASTDRPYLCIRLNLHLPDIAALVLDADAGPLQEQARPPRGLRVSRVTDALLDAVLRLMHLLDTPLDMPVLAPLVLREIHYRVLSGDLGAGLRHLVVAQSHGQRIARAIDLLKRRYAEPVSIEEVADAAHMSPSSLHQHFKSVTALSPLQFQKQLRLHQARRLMLTEGLDAASAGHRVGYESPSQFSREYRRLFGAPPRAEVAGLRRRDAL
jgi:AraC-like DNA-binding protein